MKCRYKYTISYPDCYGQEYCSICYEPDNKLHGRTTTIKEYDGDIIGYELESSTLYDDLLYITIQITQKKKINLVKSRYDDYPCGISCAGEKILDTFEIDGKDVIREYFNGGEDDVQDRR